MSTTEFDWAEELHQTVVKSLTTSFGLDFLLLNDQQGGDVNTIHNARQGIYATEAERQRYEQRGDYDSHHYHRHESYIATNREGKRQHEAGTLTDTYTGKQFAPEDVKNLDHIIAAHEIHHDAGRILAGQDGADLANDASNLTFTNESLNKSKKAKTMADFVTVLQKQHQATTQEIAALRSKPALSEQEQKHLSKLENKAAADFERMKDADRQAREKYESTVNEAYYGSSKFAKNVAGAALNNGLRMGTRQMLGLVLAEIWFEFRERIPAMIDTHRHAFNAGNLLSDMGDALRAVWARIQAKFHVFLTTFKDGAIGGVLSSVTTTLLNIVFTTQRSIVRLIREMWNSLVQAFKVMVFNPEGLPPGQLAKAVSKLLAAGLAVVAGVIVNEALNKMFLFPFGPELAAFCSALATGLLTLVMNYFLEHSSMMKKVWAFLDAFKDKSQKALEYYQRVNAELDRYLLELSALEFAINTAELAEFSRHLAAVNGEVERGLLLQAEVERRKIELPFEAGSTASVRDWLNTL
ncbi:cobalamin adenosyltransferase [Erwinia sp. S43]|uniref:cobalamin adenosyltransferase n=1 Tax=Erwinia sp. S43 TaxID=2769339 RepID=UPI0019093FF9|nr:cobalamin adenosyltransferase [Erwinia sp. S43]MBK0032081.1 cobalamin adenosyltransferase [Erwinia sp. S43]